MRSRLLFWDNHLVAVSKPAGMPVQPEPEKPQSVEEEVKDWLKAEFNKPGAVFLGVIHRLDMPVTGLVLLARTSKALERMNAQFRSRTVKKTYWAWVEGKMKTPEATLQGFLQRDDRIRKSRVFAAAAPGRDPVSLAYKVIKESGSHSLLELDLHTGRKHQIRAQLSGIGHPIAGDLKYGAARSYPEGRILLHSYSLAFEHPVQKEPLLLLAEPDEGFRP